MKDKSNRNWFKSQPAVIRATVITSIVTICAAIIPLTNSIINKGKEIVQIEPSERYIMLINIGEEVSALQISSNITDMEDYKTGIINSLKDKYFQIGLKFPKSEDNIKIIKETISQLPSNKEKDFLHIGMLLSQIYGCGCILILPQNVAYHQQARETLDELTFNLANRLQSIGILSIIEQKTDLKTQIYPKMEDIDSKYTIEPFKALLYSSIRNTN